MGDFDLTESVLAGDFRVDRENFMVYGCKLMNSVSRNKRKYKAKARGQIREAYEGEAVNIGHGKKGWTDGLAVVKNTRQDPSDPEGELCDLKLKPKHALTEQFMDDCEDVDFRKTVALSIEIPKGKWKGKTRNGLLEIDEVSGVNPLAVVGRGGTTYAINESLDDEPEAKEMELKDLTIEQLEAERPDLLVTVRETEAEKGKSERGDLLVQIQKEKTIAAQTQAKLDEAEEKLAAIEAENNRQARTEETKCMCDEKKLVVAEEMLEHLVDSDDETRGFLIEQMAVNVEQLEEEHSEVPPKKPFKPTGAKPKAQTKSFSKRIAEAVKNGQ